MATDIKINYQATQTLGNNVTSKGEAFNDCLNRIRDLNENLKSYWEGSDQIKYANNVEEKSQPMYKLANTINEIGSFLVRVGQAYEKVNQENQASIK